MHGLVYLDKPSEERRILIQAKLLVSNPSDPSELEADRIADNIMGIPDTSIANSNGKESRQGRLINRRSSNDINNEISRVSIYRTPSDPSNIETNVNSVISGSGSSLDSNTKEFMESRFGYDFNNVRIHTDTQAARSAKSVNALAYTVGNDIVFGQGQYQPATVGGKRLIAHELTHIIQRDESSAADERSIPGRLAPKTLSRISSSDDDIMLQRDSANPEIGPAPVQDSGTSSAAEQRVPVYQIKMSDHTTGFLPEQAALQILQDHFQLVTRQVEFYAGWHAELKKVHDDQAFVAWVSDVFGGVSFPDITMWDEPRGLLASANASIASRDVLSAESNLERADKSKEACKRIFLEYKEGTISGAETTVTVLQGILVADAIVGTALTGGAELGALAPLVGGATAETTVAGTGIVGSALAAGGMGTTVAASQDIGKQGGEMIYGDRKEFDWTELLAKSVGGFASGFLSGLLSGALTPIFRNYMGSYLSDAISDAELEAMGIERQAFLTLGQKFITKLLAGQIANLTLAAPVNYVAEQIAESKKSLTPEEAVMNVVKDMGKDALSTFIELLKSGERFD